MTDSRRGGGARRIGRGSPSADRSSGRAGRRGGGTIAPLPESAPLGSADRERALVDAARTARTRARARYSTFEVGAALETPDGRTITGCNVESASYGLTVCAERVALVKALSEGHTTFTRIAVVADTRHPTPPCGACRQLLWEYCGDIQVILASPTAVKRRYRLGTLIPEPFDDRLLR